MSLKLSVIAIQMFAAIFMSLTYFRSKYDFLDICEKNMHSNINKSKISLVKTIRKAEERKESRGRKDTIKLVLTLLIIIAIVYFFKLSYIVYLSNSLNPNIFLTLTMLFIFSIIGYSVHLSIQKSELLMSRLSLRIHSFLYKLLYLVSKKGYISGLGFIYLFSSFIFSIVIEVGDQKAKYFILTELFAMFYTLIGLGTLGVISNSYYQVKYKK